MNFEQQNEPTFEELASDYRDKKNAYDQYVSETQKNGTFWSDVATKERKSMREGLEATRLGLEKNLQSQPELLVAMYKAEWRKFFDNELRLGHQTYESLLRGGNPGHPSGEDYEFVGKVMRQSNLLDDDERIALVDATLEEAHQAFLEEERTKREAEEGERLKIAELPQQKEAVTTSKEKPKREFSPNLEMDAELRDVYLSYADAPVTGEEKMEMLKWTRESESAQKYAESFRHLAKRRNLTELEEIAKEMVTEVKKILTKLGIPISSYGESRTWALWDIAKQEYFAEHPEENDSRYALGGIFEIPEKKKEIVNRHIGWEIYKASHDGKNISFIDKLDEGKKNKIMTLLEKPPKENGTLASDELARLGALVR